jgi:hypothetical protein
MSDIEKYDLWGPKGHLKALSERIAANDANDKDIQINVHFSQSAGSDPLVIALIERSLENQLPFGLKCESSMIVYIPARLVAYWAGKMEAAFSFETFGRLVDSVKMQYLSHKEFVGMEKLLSLVALLKLANEELKQIG